MITWQPDNALNEFKLPNQDAPLEIKNQNNPSYIQIGTQNAFHNTLFQKSSNCAFQVSELTLPIQSLQFFSD